MPHVIFLHSALTQDRIVTRDPKQLHRLFRFELIDIVIAMGMAGMINAAMLIMAASTFWEQGLTEIASIEEAHRTLEPLLGSAASVIFAISLLASGLSSSTVGTMAGQVIMQGFIERHIPIWLRRGLTMIPALIVIAIGLDPDADAGPQPGRALVRDPVRADPAGDVHGQAGLDGDAGQPAVHDDPGQPGCGYHRRTECLLAL